jgi:DNA end-binding protein Ku
MANPSFSGSVRLSLVSFAVKGFQALESETATPHLNQLHEDCLNRIRYKKVCEVHGEVLNEDIVLGFNTGGDHYVVIDPGELDALRSEKDRSITIDKFVPAASIDPIYFSGTTYYLVPDGKHSAKPYAVFQKAIADEKVIGIATVVITNREKLVALRPVGHMLTASVLHYAETVRGVDYFDVPESTVTAQELKLAKTLIEASISKDPELGQYSDLYAQRLNELVQAKVAGRKLSGPTKSKSSAPPVINFMEVLKMSLDQRKSARGGRPRKTGTAVKKKAPPIKRKKSG